MAATLPLTRYRMLSWFSGWTNSSIRSGVGIEEYASHLLLYFLIGPLGILIAKERRFVLASTPVEQVCRLPPLFRRHSLENLYLLGAGLFVRQHEAILMSHFTRASSWPLPMLRRVLQRLSRRPARCQGVLRPFRPLSARWFG